MNDRFALALALSSLLASPARAQEAQGIDATGVARAVVESNPTVRSAVIEHARAARLVTAEEARYGWFLRVDGDANVGTVPALSSGGVTLPTIQTFNLGAQVQRTFAYGTSVTARLGASRSFRRVQLLPNTTETVAIGPGYGLDVSLTLTQPLLRGAGRGIGLAARDAARYDRERLASAAQRQASQILLEALSAYYELWYATEAKTIEGAARDLAERQRADAEARASIGTVARPDVLALEARVASLEEAMLAREQDIATRSADLSRLTAAGAGDGVLRPDEGPDVTLGDGEEGAIEAALAASPELLELAARIDAAEREATIAADALRPRLDVSLAATARGLGYESAGAAVEQLGRFEAVQLTANVIYEMPLDGTRRREERARARMAVEMAQQAYEAARAQVVSRVQAQLAALDAARRRVALADRTVEVSRRLAAAQAERFAIGAIAVTPVLEAANDLREAELRSARARVDVALAYLGLRHLEGGLVTPYAARLTQVE